MSNSKVIFVEGGIAAGKTTLLSLLEQNLESSLRKIDDSYRVHIFKEPLDEWRSIGGHNILEHFYKDQERWSFTFQMNAFITRVKGVETILNSIPKDDGLKHIVLGERSFFHDRNVFGYLLYKDSKMNEMEWAIYNNLHKFLVSKTMKIDQMVYLLTEPHLCVKRKQNRNRNEEKGVPDEYISRVAQRYLDLYEEHVVSRAKFLSTGDEESPLVHCEPIGLMGANNFRDIEGEKRSMIETVTEQIIKSW